MGTADTRHSITLPELGLEGIATTLSVWLVPLGTEVIAGDRIVEVLAGDVTVDLPAPVTGVLIETFAVEDDPVKTGQVLGIMQETDA